MTTETPEKPLTKTQERAKARADVFFMLYASLGADRSLARVQELAGAAGVKPARNFATASNRAASSSGVIGPSAAVAFKES